MYDPKNHQGIAEWIVEFIESAWEKFVEITEADLGSEATDKVLDLLVPNNGNEKETLTWQVVLRLAGRGYDLDQIIKVFWVASGFPETVQQAQKFLDEALILEDDEDEEEIRTTLRLVLHSFRRSDRNGQHYGTFQSQSEIRSVLLRILGTSPKSQEKDFILTAILATAREMLRIEESNANSFRKTNSKPVVADEDTDNDVITGPELDAEMATANN